MTSRNLRANNTNHTLPYSIRRARYRAMRTRLRAPLAWLLHRRLIVELGRSNAPGRPILYGTAFEFLERFGLESLDQLPALDADVAARLAEEGGVLLLPIDDDA